MAGWLCACCVGPAQSLYFTGHYFSSLLMKTLLTCALFLFLTACGSTVYYRPPANPAPSEVASIIGTRLPTGKLLKDQRFFPYTIDGVAVEDADDYSEKALLIPPGQRVVTIRFEQASLAAEADFVLSVTPGQKLKIAGRIVSYGSTIINGHLPAQVGFSVVDTTTGVASGPEIVKAVTNNAVAVVPVYMGK
jgi:hypothetical protein